MHLAKIIIFNCINFRQRQGDDKTKTILNFNLIWFWFSLLVFSFIISFAPNLPFENFVQTHTCNAYYFIRPMHSCVDFCDNQNSNWISIASCIRMKWLKCARKFSIKSNYNEQRSNKCGDFQLRPNSLKMLIVKMNYAVM